MSGVRLYFTHEITGTTSNFLIGSQTDQAGVAYQPQEKDVNGKLIVKAEICMDTVGYTRGLYFHYADGTVVKNPAGITNCSTNDISIIPTSGNFQGAIRGLSIVIYQSTGICNTGGYRWAFIVDNNACSLTTIQAFSIPTMIINAGSVSTELDLTPYSGNSHATSVGNSNACGLAYYYSINPTQSFLSFSVSHPALLIGQTSNPLDVSSYTIAMTIRLQPYGATKTQNFSVQVQACIVQAPVCATASVTVEIGIAGQPFDIPFTQTQACGVSATLTSNPSGQDLWLALNSNNSSGGNIRINTATLANVGTYSLTIANLYASQTVFDTLTLIIKDPCSRAFYVTSTNPFQTLTLDMSSTNILQTAFKVLTDVEIANPTIICPITATKTAGLSCVTINASSNKTLVDPGMVSLPADIGTHQINVQVTSTNHSTTVTTVNFTFDLLITCVVSSLTIQTAVTDFNYTLKSPAISTGTFTPVQVNDCKSAVTWTNSQYSNDNLVGSVGSATNFNATTTKFTFSFTDPALIGTVQKYILKATIPQMDAGGQLMNDEQIVRVTIHPDCLNTSLVDTLIAPMSIIVTGSASQSIQFADTTAIFHNDPSKCGARQYTFSGGQPSYLSIDYLTATLTLYTINATDRGTYDVSLTVTLADYPTVSGLTKTFRVTITCLVQSLAFTTNPTKMLIEPGLTIQPMIQTLTISQSPDCSNALSVSFTTSQPAFVLVQANGNTVSVSVLGATLAHTNVYPLTLRAFVDSQSVDTTIFQVEISDPCKRAVFNANSPLADMILIRDFDSTKTQPFSVQTDIQTSFNLVCSLTASLVSPPVYVTLQNMTIYANASQTSVSDVGSKAISVLIISTNFPQSVAAITYSFNLHVQHCIVNNFNIPQNDNKSFAINSGPTPLIFIQAEWSDQACLYQVTYTATIDGSPVLPAWLTLDGANRTFMLAANQQQQVGLYVIELTATILQPSDASGFKKVTTSFQLNVQNGCATSQFIQRPISNMVTQPFSTASVQNIFVEDSEGILHSQASYCGPRIYTVLPVYQFLQISGDTLTLLSQDLSETGVYDLTFKVTLQNFSEVQAFTTTFKVTIQCEAPVIQRIISPPLTSKYRIQVDKTLSFSFQFAQPTTYSLVYSLTPALSFVTLSNSDKTITVETSNFQAKGVYKLELDATINSSCYVTTLTTQFELELLNLCETTVFYIQSIPDMHLFKQDPQFKARQVIQFGDYKYEALQIYNLDCGALKTELQVFDSNEAPPEWIKLSSGSINLDFSRLQKPTSLKLNLVTYLEQYPNRRTSSSFQVSLISSELSCQPSVPQEYSIGSPPLQFEISFKNKTSKFGIPLTPVIKAVAFDELGTAIALPGFVSFNAQSQQFKINKISQNDFGNLFVGLSLGYSEYPGFEVVCRTKLTVTYQVKFEGDEIAHPQLVCGRPWSVSIPQYKDYFDQPAFTEVNLGAAKQFLSYSPATRNITTGDFDTSDLGTGSFTIQVKNTDVMMNSRSEIIEFQILCSKGMNKTQDEPLKWTPSDSPQPHPPRPLISQINQFGRVRIIFTKPIVLPTFQLYQEFTQEKFMRQNCTNTTQDLDLCIHQASSRRMLKQEKRDNQTQEAVEIVNRGLVFINETFIPIFSLKMLAGIESDLAQLNMTWFCEDFKQTHLDFQIIYEQFQNVSIYDSYDRLEAQIYGVQYFRSVEDNEYIEPSVSVMQRAVPLQLDPLSKNLIIATQAFRTVSKAVLVGQFFLNFFLGSAIQQLFSSIRKLTIMVHLLMINVKIPAHAQVFFKELLEFVTFNVINTEPYLRKGLNLYDTEVIEEKFLQLGYASNYFIINMGSVFIVMIYLVALLIFYVCTKKVENQYLRRVRDYLTNGLIRNTVLSFLMESYLLLAISSITNLRIFKIASAGTGLSLIFAILGSLPLIGFPIFVLCFLKKKSKQLNFVSYREKFGTLYEELSYKRGGNQTLLEPFFSLLRILLLILALLLLQEYRYFQLFFSNFCMTFMIIYVGLSNCYVSKTKSFFEQFNEVFVALTNYHLMCFADFVQDQKTRNIVGDSMIAFVGLNLLINLSFTTISAVKDSFFELRKAFYEAKKKRLMKSKAMQRTKIIAQIEDESNHVQLKQAVNKDFQKRPMTFQIDELVILEDQKDQNSSLSEIASESSSQQFQENLILRPRPKLLPSQIQCKSSQLKTLALKAKIHAMNAHGQEEEKLPNPQKTKFENFNRENKDSQLHENDIHLKDHKRSLGILDLQEVEDLTIKKRQDDEREQRRKERVKSWKDRNIAKNKIIARQFFANQLLEIASPQLQRDHANGSRINEPYNLQQASMSQREKTDLHQKQERWGQLVQNEALNPQFDVVIQRKEINSLLNPPYNDKTSSFQKIYPQLTRK